MVKPDGPNDGDFKGSSTTLTCYVPYRGSDFPV